MKALEGKSTEEMRDKPCSATGRKLRWSCGVWWAGQEPKDSDPENTEASLLKDKVTADLGCRGAMCILVYLWRPKTTSVLVPQCCPVFCFNEIAQTTVWKHETAMGFTVRQRHKDRDQLGHCNNPRGRETPRTKAMAVRVREEVKLRGRMPSFLFTLVWWNILSKWFGDGVYLETQLKVQFIT